MTKLVFVVFTVRIPDAGVDVNVGVTTARVVAVIGLEHCRIVMAGTWLVSTGEVAHQPATKSRMVASRTADVCNADCIRCGEDEKWIVVMELLIACVPDNKSLMLKRGEVIDAREEEGVEVLGGVGSWDKTSW